MAEIGVVDDSNEEVQVAALQCFVTRTDPHLCLQCGPINFDTLAVTTLKMQVGMRFEGQRTDTCHTGVRIEENLLTDCSVWVVLR